MRAATQREKADECKIVLTGGGSGGHITPLLAVAEELKRRRPDIKLVYIGERGSKFQQVVNDSSLIDEVYAIPAGKFRRYHGDSWFRKLFDIKSNALNLRDIFRVAAGFAKSYRLLRRIRPSGVFMRGGFVSLPVCKTAGWLNIPYITHESDMVPSLTNKLLAKGASLLATGMPAEFYDYPREKTVFTGIPITGRFEPVDGDLQKRYRQELDIRLQQPVLFVTGGGLGAHRLNVAVVSVLEELIKTYPDIVVLHQTGKGNTGVYRNASQAIRDHVRAEEFVTELFKYSGAADVVITRAGATAVAEMAAQHKACIVVPNPQLTDGHQTKNAEQWARNNMALVLSEKELAEDPDSLVRAIKGLLDEPKTRKSLGDALAKLARPDAAAKIADILLTTFCKG